ncbi:MAG: TetR/AcrR family transcriptional regulator [Candidatus Thorarchaeota archaeon]
MRKSKAKEAIVKTAQKLIEDKGYINLNINKVAYVAKVSVGTLYYHFPKGKVDILAEIMSRKVEGYLEVFDEQLRKDIMAKGKNLDEMLRLVFKKVIEFRRADRQFLVGIQNEMFSNPEEYKELLEKYDMTSGVQQGMSVLADIFMKASKEKFDLKGKETQILRIVGLLMSYQIIFPGYFGDDDEFVNLALKIFFEILKP